MSSQPKNIKPYLRPLVTAIKKNSIENVRQFLIRAQNDYEQESNSVTPLHHAAEGGNVKIVKLLFEHGYGTLNALNRVNKTPLQLALKKNHEDVIKYLLQNGAKSSLQPTELKELINTYIKTQNLENLKCLIQGETIDHLTIYKAVQENCLESLKCLLELGGIIDMTSSLNVLHTAAENGNLEMVKFFFNHGYDVIGAKNNMGQLPLHLAVTNRHEEVVKFLIDNGAKKFLTSNQFNDIIKKSIESNCLYILKALNSSDTVPDSVLNCAATNGNLETLKFLMECGVKITWNSSVETPLQCAARCGHLDIVKYLSENEHVINEAKSFNGTTPLILAIMKGHLEIVKYFYKSQNEGSINHEQESKKLSSLFHQSARHGHVDIMKYLIECGADINAKHDGKTVLHYAVRWRNVNVVQLLVEQGVKELHESEKIEAEWTSDSILTILLKAGHSMETYFGKRKPIVIASQLGYSKFVEALISSGVETISKEDYKAALNAAVMKTKAEVVDILLKANSSDATATGLDTLEYIIRKSYKHYNYMSQIEILRNLLDRAPKEEREHFVMTCINWAVEDQSPIIILKGLLDYDINNNYKLSMNCLKKRFHTFNVLINHIEKLETLLEFESLILRTKPLPTVKIEFNQALILRIVFLKSLAGNCEDEEVHLNFVTSYNLEEWCQKCEKEIEIMKKAKISFFETTTYFDILSKSVHKVVNYIRNKNRMSLSRYSRFNLYQKYFDRKIVSAKSRSLVIDQSQKCLYNVVRQNLHIHLPDEIVDNISEYLRLTELYRLNEAFPELSS